MQGYDDEMILDHPFTGELVRGASCQYRYPRTVVRSEDALEPLRPEEICGQQAMVHANPGPTEVRHWLKSNPHDYMDRGDGSCGFRPGTDLAASAYCGYPQMLHVWAERDRAQAARSSVHSLVRKADAAQYERPPMPDEARRGPVVTLIDAPVDPLGTLAVIGGIYSGRVARSKAEVSDDARRSMMADMQATVLDGPLEAIQFTFLVEGVDRAFTHQAVRSRFSFIAQESLRFAVAEDWAQEVPLPPSLAHLPQDAPAVGVWRKALNAAEDNYNALIGAGMPAEEARGVLPHAITTRYYWTVSLRTLLQEAGKRTCTQAQFAWRVVFAGVAKALRERGNHSQNEPYEYPGEFGNTVASTDGWQYRSLADLIRPVCYQQGGCKFMAKFDRGCTIRARVDDFEREGVPSAVWHDSETFGPGAIDPAEWATNPAAARTTE